MNDATDQLLTDQSNNDREPPSKRPKTQACSRCRRRKQKCDGQRPCSNCSRSGEHCNEPTAAPTPHSQASFSQPNQNASPHMPLAWLGDIASLEERISRLEESNVQSSAQSNLNASDTSSRGHGLGAVTNRRRELPLERRMSSSARNEPEDLSRSSPAIGLLATFARSEVENVHETSIANSPTRLKDVEGTLDQSTEDSLFETYQHKVQCRYPFLHLPSFQDPSRRHVTNWMGYFTNMIFSIGLLLERSSRLDPSQTHQAFYRIAVTRYLSHVFAEPDRLLHIQAYLLLAMHAIYSPSTERIMSIASATMRYCVMAQFHLADAEPEPTDVTAKVQIQMRRRVFWSAYTLDRAVSTALDLPFSIPDYQITVKLFANINDHELEKCADHAENSQSRFHLTSVSYALHVVYCRQIQSEILNMTLHRDFTKQFDRLSHWRHGVLGKLDRWKTLCHRHSDPRSTTFTSNEWLNMMYNYSLAMLYQPTRSTVAGPAGDWTVKSCVQACLIFRKFQRETQRIELWLGLVVQFKCGVALLYCFFATPPHLRSAAYELPEASEAVRACSIILSIFAESWPQARCARDAFDILAREIPLFETSSTSQGIAGPKRMRQESSEALIALLAQLEPIIVHRNTLKLIKEMATEEFPWPTIDQEGSVEGQTGAAECPDGDSPLWSTSMNGDIFQPVTPFFFLPDVSNLDPDGFDYMALGFPGEFDPSMPF